MLRFHKEGNIELGNWIKKSNLGIRRPFWGATGRLIKIIKKLALQFLG